MKYTIITILSLLSFFPSLLHAQNGPKIVFESRTYNFDTIMEADGIVKGIFKFTNEGDEPLIIKDVLPGCGCTTSGWTKRPVNPGFSGEITANFDPSNRPGLFDKILSVKTNDPESSFVVLFINGYVVPAPKTIADKYPTRSGNLQFISNHISYGEITKTENRADTIYMYNSLNREMSIETSSLPAHISVEVPPVLQAGAEGKMVVHYNAGMKDDWGLQFDRFRLSTNDDEEPVKFIIISATVIDDYSSLTEKELRNAPKIVFETNQYDFGTIKEGEKVTHSYKFWNKGNSDLVLKKIKSTCGCTTGLPEKMTIKPGEESMISLTFDSANRTGKQHKLVTIVSNDPSNQIVNISIIGDVVK